ncbi:hypothetical protein [Halothermothrix orenii]|uniref:Autotransporter beta-domain protein n=1 Tax=Halothermothrix orenii (strain H 168 / OCM 544 / DSM 9562) TaxID=373903 RepID=B8D1V3_HALOH|nr:hypothetical protein [Halothermothrix orenii]ACL69180.1 Autotransporter beta-domain protein [Halothermothrix orenii H 168]
MKKFPVLLSLVLVLLLALPAFAVTNVEFSGNANFNFWEFYEVDGKANYSMNGIPGAVFGIGDYKQSTSDNKDDNRERLEMGLNLNMNVKVDNIVNIDANFVGLHEEMNMDYNGTDETYSQDQTTPKDNAVLRLGDLTITATPEFGEIIITNNFNYNFNNKVLAAQFRDNWGDMSPYGEGILIKKDIAGISTQSFLYKTEINSNDREQVDFWNPNLEVQQMVYGVDLKKNISLGKVGALLVRTHDERADEAGSYFGKDLDNTHIALTGELYPNNMVKINGEFITAIYGDDVDTIYNTVPYGWIPEPQEFDLSAPGAKEDTNVIEVGATITPIAGLQLTGTYKDVGEDYIAVQGNSHARQSWFGDESFGPDQRFDYVDGCGYEKGFKLDGSYMLPVNLAPQITGMFTQYEETRSALNDAADNSVTIARVETNVSGALWKADTSYRWRNNKAATENNGILFNEFNVNGSYTVLDDGITKVGLTGEVNYYTGSDEEVEDNKNFANEIRVRAGVNGSYKLNNRVDLTASYDFGIAREDSDLLTGSAMQNLFKAGLSYKVSQNTTFTIGYQFDAYQLNDINDPDDDFVTAMSKREAHHIWYDGAESWQPRNPDYEGYTTHSVKASYNITF